MSSSAGSHPFAAKSVLDHVPTRSSSTFIKAMGLTDALSPPSIPSSTSTVALSTMISTLATVALAPNVVLEAGSESGQCELLGPFSLFIQGALGALALLSLVYKRWREKPRRPWKIWGFDVSKQVVGSVLLHIANLLMSMLSSGELSKAPKSDPDFTANPCSFYLLNLAIDTTIGIPILIFLLHILTQAFLLTPMAEPPESIQSGNYGSPPKTTWWLKQCLIYFIGLLGMKSCVFIIFQLCPWIVRVGDWALRWTEGNETVQVFFVMLFFPVVMNAIQYYIIDGFIKNQKPLDHEPIPSEDEGDGVDQDEDHPNPQRTRKGDYSTVDAVIESDEEDGAVNRGYNGKRSRADDEAKLSDKVTGQKGEPKKVEEYNPDTDGEESPSLANSSEASSSKSKGRRTQATKTDPQVEGRFEQGSKYR